MKSGITAVIVVNNELEELVGCLSSIYSYVNEILLINVSGDKNLLNEFKDSKTKIINKPQVQVVEEIREASINLGQYEYVLVLDPDERLPKSLATKLKEISLDGKLDYVKIPRQNYIFGKALKYSDWWPDYQIRFFRQGKVSWPQELHAVPSTQGTGETMPADPKFAIEHQNYASIDHWLEKNKRYAKRDAIEVIEKGGSLTLAQTLQKSIGQIMGRFYRSKGFLDGQHGLTLAILQSYYYFLVYFYYWEQKKFSSNENESTIADFPLTWFRHGYRESLYWHGERGMLGQLKAKIIRRLSQ